MTHRRRSTDSRADGAGLFWFYDRDDLDLTWRELAWAFLPALGVLGGAWIALVWAWTL